MKGFVEQLDEIAGVTGWAVDPEAPDLVLTVELLGGAEVLSTTTTGGIRADVAESIDLDCQPGYRFPPDVGDRIREAALRGVSGELVVRVVGYDAPLESLAGPRTLELVRLTGAGRPPRSREVLLERLSHHVATAEVSLDRPLRPSADRRVGYVEGLAVDEAGLIWAVGWMNRDVAVDRALVILDHAKYPAGFACVTAPRADLPDTACAFVAVIQADWRPSPTLEPYFFICDGTARYLECIAPMPLRTRQELSHPLSDVFANADGGHPEMLRELFRANRSWALDTGDPLDKMAVDEVAILPGFGALVSGWALSPTRTWNAMVLKVGSRVLVADDETLTRRARPDLAGIYPGAEQAMMHAGFVVSFRGEIAPERADAMVLKAVWQDGTGTNVAISGDRLRVLGTTAPLDRARIFYPAIESEPFFPEFARHAAIAAAARARVATPFAIAPAARAVVLVAPASRSDAYLVFENAMQEAAALPPGHGLVVLARPDDDRSAVVALFAELRQATARPCSLFFIADPAAAAYALASVAEQIGLERFMFVGVGTLLTRAGWSAAADLAPGLTLLEVRDPAADPSMAGVTGLTAFAADRKIWMALLNRLPAVLEGPGGVDLPDDVRKTARIVSDAALSLRSDMPPSLVRRINTAIASTHV